MPLFDFVKDDCAVGSAVLGKRGYNLSSTQSMVLFHENQRKKSFLIWQKAQQWDGVRNVAGCIYYSRKRVSIYCIFNFWCLVLTQNSSHTSQKMKQHDISSSSLWRQRFAKSRFVLNNLWRHTFSNNIYYKMRIVANRTGFYKVSMSTENIIHVQYII